MYATAMSLWWSLVLRPHIIPSTLSSTPAKDASMFNIFPFLVMAADWSENVGILTMLDRYPGMTCDFTNFRTILWSLLMSYICIVVDTTGLQLVWMV
jgi:hypothetical protein